MNSMLRGVSARGLLLFALVSLSACQLLEDVVAENPSTSGTGGTAAGGGGLGAATSAGSGGLGGRGSGAGAGGSAGVVSPMAGTAGVLAMAGSGGVGLGGSASGSGGDSFAGSGGSGGSVITGGVTGFGGGAGTLATGGSAGVGGTIAGTGGSAGMGTSSTFVPCQITSPAFCERMDAPQAGGRAGDLDETRWNASRLALTVNGSSGPYVAWVPTQVSGCGQAPATLQADGDLLLCASGRVGLHDALHLDGTYNREIDRTLMVRQPFDFANRTGTIAFELASAGPVDNVEVWVTRDPWTGLAQSLPFPTSALRVRLSSYVCSGNSARFSVTSASVQGTPTDLSPMGSNGCIDTGTDVFVHYEIRVTLQSVQVYVTTGSAPPVLATSFVGAIGLTRGYVHLVHTRIQTDGDPSPSAVRELRWGSVAFDGPVLSAGRNYEVADSLTPVQAESLPAGSLNIGYRLVGGESTTLAVDGVDITGTSLATLFFDTYGALADSPLQVRANGRTYRSVSATAPSGQFREVGLSFPVADLVAGRNTLEFLASSTGAMVANVSLHLEQQATGGNATAGR